MILFVYTLQLTGQSTKILKVVIYEYIHQVTF